MTRTNRDDARVRATTIAFAIVVAAGACTADDELGSPSTTPDGSIATTASTTVATATDEGPCAWAVRADKETLNIAYPDTAATYWGVSYDLAPGETLELRGRFPFARYGSFISYGPSGGAIDVLADRDILPDAGSANPFAGGDPAADERSYTVVISGDPTEAGEPNVIGAAPGREAAASTTTTTATSTTASTTASSTTASTGTPDEDGAADEDPGVVNRLGSGRDQRSVSGTVLYRVYVPDDEDDPTGGTGLPDVAVIGADGARAEVETCAAPGASPRAVDLVEANGPATDRPAPPQPIFLRPAAGAANLFPNPDNVYIATIVEHRPGRVVVIEGKAPEFPDPPNGRPVGSGEQVRYWSLCTNEYRKPYPVSECVIDRDTVLDEEGRYTFVISTAADRPANATADGGVTWLDWGSTEVNNLLLMRHMLASPDFAESAINLEYGALATTTMGDFAPSGVYCDTATFEEGGADACRAAATP